MHAAGSEVITYDNQTMKAAKYEVQGKYDLIIKDVQMEDEGHYDLDAGDEVVRISLSVAGNSFTVDTFIFVLLGVGL